MNRLITLILLLGMSTFGYSQYYYVPSSTPGNPGGVNNDDAEFPVGGGLPATWTSILTGNNASATWSATQTIPFAFDFNGGAVTQYKVSSSGVLTFTTGAGAAPGYANAAIPNAAIPDASVMIWGIEGSGANDEIVTQTFGTAPNRQHWVFFASYTAASWTYWSIVLEETTNDIFIVDQRHSTAATPAVTAGIQVNATTAYSVAGSPALGPLAGQNATDDDNYYYQFIQGTQQAYDMSAIADNMPAFEILNQAPFDIEGEVINLGSTAITSYDINYTVNGGATVTAAVNPGSIPSFGTHNFTSSMPWTPAATGTYNIDIWASNLNGNADGNPTNDIYSFVVEVVDTFIPRRVLMETYTSSTCGPCVPANQNLEALYADAQNAGKFTSIKFQMSWPGAGDPYYTLEGGNRRNYYGINSIPRVEIDGGFDGNGTAVTQQLIDEAADLPAFVALDATFQRSGAAGEEITVDVDVNPVADINNNNLTLHMAVIEWETFNNVESNGETEFANVMKKMLPDDGGTTVAPLVAGTMQSFTESYTFQGNYRLPADAQSPINHTTEHSVEEFTDLGVVVWLEDMTSKVVYQSTYGVEGAVAIDPAKQTGLSATVYPNPTSGFANVAVNMEEIADLRITVRNMLGAVVIDQDMGTMTDGEHKFSMNFTNIDAGMYLVEVKAGERVTTEKLMITK